MAHGGCALPTHDPSPVNVMVSLDSPADDALLSSGFANHPSGRGEELTVAFGVAAKGAVSSIADDGVTVPQLPFTGVAADELAPLALLGLVGGLALVVLAPKP